MADTPIYENPNGRRRRAARGSTQFRDYVKSSKIDMEKLPGLKYNVVEQAANVTGRDVTAPWADGANFRSGLGGERTPVDYGYDKKEIQEFIQETAKVAKENYGLDNIKINTVYGLNDSFGGMEGQFTWNPYNTNDNFIDIYVDTIWKNTALDENGNLLKGGVKKFKERIKYTIGHEMRHQWQHNTEEGKAIEEANDVYKQTKMNDYTDDFDKYYYEPVEVDARLHGDKFKKSYKTKLKKYKKKLEQQGFNKEFRNKMEEINLRPKNRIIGHQFEKKPININSYRKFDNVEPIDWDIDTGNKSPISKYDMPKNTRYRNAKLSKGQKKLRPTITMDGNNIDIDSIYNHAVPKKIPLTKKDIAKAIIGNAVENIAQEAVEEIAQETVKETAQEVVKGTAQETVEEIAKNTTKVVGNIDDPTTWTDEFIEQMAEDDPYYFDELQRRRQEAINNKAKGQPQVDPNDPTTWTEDYMDEISEGDPDYYEQLKKQRQDAIDGKTKIPETKPNSTANNINNKPNYTNYGPRIEPTSETPDVNKMPISNRTNINTGPIASPVIQNYDPNIRTDLEAPSKLGKLSKMDIAMTGLNIVGAIGDYKDARRKGHGVVSSAARAGVKFAVDEALGWWALPISLAKTVPGAIIKGADMLHKENRRMNSAANFQTFGDAQFMDTQQLATMRQSGMEMAKMSQYNLQQTLMGNEATYLHR